MLTCYVAHCYVDLTAYTRWLDDTIKDVGHSIICDGISKEFGGIRPCSSMYAIIALKFELNKPIIESFAIQVEYTDSGCMGRCTLHMHTRHWPVII